MCGAHFSRETLDQFKMYQVDRTVGRIFNRSAKFISIARLEENYLSRISATYLNGKFSTSTIQV